jgi:hypothetical protein
MGISPQAKNTLENFDTPQFNALHEVRDELIKSWLKEGIKKETEFETIWAMAKREGKIEGTLELIRELNM